MPELTYAFAMQVEITKTLGIKTISAANTGIFYQNYPDGWVTPSFKAKWEAWVRKRRSRDWRATTKLPEKWSLGHQLRKSTSLQLCLRHQYIKNSQLLLRKPYNKKIPRLSWANVKILKLLELEINPAPPYNYWQTPCHYCFYYFLYNKRYKEFLLVWIFDTLQKLKKGFRDQIGK